MCLHSPEFSFSTKHLSEVIINHDTFALMRLWTELHQLLSSHRNTLNNQYIYKYPAPYELIFKSESIVGVRRRRAPAASSPSGGLRLTLTLACRWGCRNTCSNYLQRTFLPRETTLRHETWWIWCMFHPVMFYLMSNTAVSGVRVAVEGSSLSYRAPSGSLTHWLADSCREGERDTKRKSGRKWV